MTALATSKADTRAAIAAARAEAKRIALVPTMGALHEGHLSLVRAAAERADFVVVSIFVNPTQFAPGEDYERYPRDLQADVELLGPLGVDLIFAPAADEMYGAEDSTSVVPGRLATLWEGAARPGHFSGVATIVTKLFGVVRPDVAFFGEKDFQQLLIVSRLAADLELGVEVVGCPIVRDEDGLALSSRNAYLSESERATALALPAALELAAELIAAGETDAVAVMEQMRVGAESRRLSLDYAAIVDPDTLVPLSTIEGPARAIIAGRVGNTRLIDNRAVAPVPALR